MKYYKWLGSSKKYHLVRKNSDLTLDFIDKDKRTTTLTLVEPKYIDWPEGEVNWKRISNKQAFLELL